MRILGGEVIDDVGDSRVGGGAEEPASHGRALHAEDERVADVVHVRQRHRPHQPLQHPEGPEPALVPGHRRRGALQGLRGAALQRVAGHHGAGHRDHLELWALAGVVGQQLLLRHQLRQDVLLQA